MRTNCLVALSGAVVLVLSSGCSDKTEPGPAVVQIGVTATDSSCQIARSDSSAGPVTFLITNGGTKVTEFYVYAPGDRVVGEIENIGPGLERQLTVNFTTPGTYQTACKPGMGSGTGIRHDFTVTGATPTATTDPRYAKSVDDYRAYVSAQLSGLRDTTGGFVAAVKSRDVSTAREFYPRARAFYERIEPVASSFPDNLDVRMDQREAGLGSGDTWTGFHRLEKDLWVQGLRPDSAPMADQLMADVNELIARINAPTYALDTIQIAGGAQGLLDEVAKTKITGEEDVYSHTDLYDFQANVDGARAALNSLRPIINQRDAALGSAIDRRFGELDAVLARYRTGGGFVSYDMVSQADRTELSRSIDALSAVVSQVQPLVAKP
jgi:iron uptake system component EfeO